MTKKYGKQPVFDEAFRRVAVRFWRQADGRHVRSRTVWALIFSTLNKWKSRLEEADLMAGRTTT
jgi:hypothetical protein